MPATRWERVKALFQRALDQPASSRDAFLEGADETPSVVEEARRLIHADALAGSFLPDETYAESSAPHLEPGEVVAGHFRIVSFLGRGGMGLVYRAEDLVLSRPVALKFLTGSLSGNALALERLKREARAAAALNHPNICVVHEIGEDQGRPFIVMELLEGKTLKQQIGANPLRTDEVLEWAAQIADGLEAAHRPGIVHRDLKPGNIFITARRQAKILDFGLAKIAASSARAAAGTNVPTEDYLTTPGVAVGTVPYMSPEQACGEELDARTDLFSFGAVLYEMATGKQAFPGETAALIQDAILHQTPPPASTVHGRVPPELDRVIGKALEKDRDLRYQSAADVVADLKRLRRDLTTDRRQALQAGGGRGEVKPVASKRSVLPWAVAVVLGVALAIVGWGWWHASKPVEQPLVRLDVDLGADVSMPPLRSGATIVSQGPAIALRPLVSGSTSSVIISPDGKRLVYVATVGGAPPKLFTRRLDQPNATELPGTEGAIFPFFSPDGRWIGFATPSKLNKISVEGGAVVPLLDILTSGASWGEHGNILLDNLAGNGLTLIPSNGGAATRITELIGGELVHADPQILPGGKDVLFTAYKGSVADVDKASIDVVSFADRRRKTLVPGATSPHYVTSTSGAGYLVYNHRQTLFAIPFDLSRLETRGAAVPILDGIAYETGGGKGHFDVSRTGTLVYRKLTGERSGITTVQWLTSAAKTEPLLAKPGVYADPSLSPDGKRLAIEVSEGSNRDVWVYDQRRDSMTRLTFGGIHMIPIWSPDGRYVFFGSFFGGIFYARSDGAGQPLAFIQSNKFQAAWNFTPDGKWLAYFEADRASGAPKWQIWAVPVERSGDRLRAGTPEQFLKTQFDDCCPVFSPDGRWLAYQSNESGRSELYVRAFRPSAPGEGGKWKISDGGARATTWSRTGELLYFSGDQIMAVNYTVQGSSFVPAKPRLWMSKLWGVGAFDIAPDGKRLAIVTPVGTPEPPKPEHEVTLVFNFADELRRRFP